MPNLSAPPFALPTRSNPGSQAGVPAGMIGELIISEVLGKYATLVKSQKVFYTSAIITAPVIFSTGAQLGPMLWNRTGSGLDAHILALGVGSPTTASTVNGALGYASVPAGASPSTATSIVAVNAYAGGGPSAMGGIFSTATVLVTAPVPVFLPLTGVNTGAVTTQALSSSWVDIGGALIIGPGNVGYVCASATLTAGVFTIGLLWAEMPV